MSDAPWKLRGEAMVAFCGRRHVVIAERYVASPVGPYLSFGVARVSRIGLRIGLRFTTMVVDNHDRLTAGRRNWGLPGEIGTLNWATVGDESVLVWHERGIEVRGQARGNGMPLYAPLRLLQHRADGEVVVPSRMRGRVRKAAVDVLVPNDDEDFVALAGSHRGVVITGMAAQLRPARVAVGHLWSGQAPAPSPDVATFK